MPRDSGPDDRRDDRSGRDRSRREDPNSPGSKRRRERGRPEGDRRGRRGTDRTGGRHQQARAENERRGRARSENRGNRAPGTGSLFDRGAVLPGVLAGLVAFLAGYATLYLLKGSEMMANFQANFGRGAQSGGASIGQLQQLGLEFPEQWKIVGLGYQGVHYVDFTISATRNGQQYASTTTGGRFYGGAISWLIPILVLVAAGALIAYYRSPDRLGEGVVSGATVVAGYLPAVVASAFLFQWTASLSNPSIGASVTMDIGPALGSALLLAGVVYPLLLGGIGGAIGSVLSSSGRDSGRARPRR
jgi:hypothetical protein